MFDKDNNSILKVGDINNYYRQHTVLLREGERIVGVASNNLENANHWDF
jgi:hypothetical protein